SGVTSCSMSPAGNRGARSSGPRGSLVPGCRCGAIGSGRSAWMLYQWVGISLSGSSALTRSEAGASDVMRGPRERSEGRDDVSAYEVPGAGEAPVTNAVAAQARARGSFLVGVLGLRGGTGGRPRGRAVGGGGGARGVVLGGGGLRRRGCGSDGLVRRPL